MPESGWGIGGLWNWWKLSGNLGWGFEDPAEVQPHEEVSAGSQAGTHQESNNPYVEPRPVLHPVTQSWQSLAFPNPRAAAFLKTTACSLTRLFLIGGGARSAVNGVAIISHCLSFLGLFDSFAFVLGCPSAPLDKSIHSALPFTSGTPNPPSRGYADRAALNARRTSAIPPCTAATRPRRYACRGRASGR